MAAPRLNRIALPLLILVSITALIHYFIYAVAARELAPDDGRRLALGALFALGVLLMPGGLLLSMSPWRKRAAPLTFLAYLWMGCFPIIWFFSLVEFAGELVRPHASSLWILPVSGGVALWALYNGLRAPRLVHHELDGPELMRGLKLAQISDLHVGMPFLKRAWLAGVVERIESAKPDLVAITGDLADGEFGEVSRMLTPLRELAPPLGKFYITGNHEYIRGGLWEHRLEELGFQVLHNSNRVLDRGTGRFLVAGVPDHTVAGFHPDLRSEPDRALTTAENVGYRILLAHQPRSVFEIREEKCDLLISGHTHGGQIFPFGLFVRLAQPVVRGFKRLNGVLVFAHQGTGHWGPPMRWLTRAEIVIFVFR